VHVKSRDQFNVGNAIAAEVGIHQTRLRASHLRALAIKPERLDKGRRTIADTDNRNPDGLGRHCFLILI